MYSMYICYFNGGIVQKAKQDVQMIFFCSKKFLYLCILTLAKQIVCTCTVTGILKILFILIETSNKMR